LKYNPYLNIWTEISNTNPFDANHGVELATFTQDDCGFGYATAGRTSAGANFAHFKFSDAADGNYIVGSSLICSSSNSTFTLQLSTPGTVTWTTSSNATIVSGQGTKTVNIKSNTGASSNGWIQASINLGCRIVTFPQKSFWAGTPSLTSVTYDGGLTPILCAGLYQSFTGGDHVLTSVAAGATSNPTFNLNTFGSPYVHGSGNGNNFNFNVNALHTDIEFTISSYFNNACGTTSTCTYFTNLASLLVLSQTPPIIKLLCHWELRVS
jgi:hypothetical protein